MTKKNANHVALTTKWNMAFAQDVVMNHVPKTTIDAGPRKKIHLVATHIDEGSAVCGAKNYKHPWIRVDMPATCIRCLSSIEMDLIEWRLGHETHG